MKRCIVILVLVLLSVAMQAQKFPSWLAGKWEIPSVSMFSDSSFEDWIEVSKNHLESRTYRKFGDDTMYFDSMSMSIEKGNVVLKMYGEKDGKRFMADFIGKRLADEVWVFECAESDSPSAIYYQKLSDNEVYVWTEVRNDSYVCSDFIMYRR
ncbi:MAG: hypothetical protein J5709_04390 [Bacteroidales bacterium]|nr:hypothetical protein [Bacteroidales bacterium]